MSGNKLLKVYHRLPSPARSVVASLRGYYLNWSRYGGGTEEQVETALERERWSREKLADLQNERLAYILERAAVKRAGEGGIGLGRREHKARGAPA